MKSILQKPLILFCITFLSLGVHAQTDCDDALYNANRTFKSGKLLETVSTLKGCLDNIKKDQQFEGYKLLALSYQNLNEQDEMNKAIGMMLKINPHYLKHPNNDPAEFSKALAKFSVSPKAVVGIYTGVNMCNVSLVQSYSTLSTPQRYKTTTGYQLGLTGEFMIQQNLGVGLNASFAGTKISHEMDYLESWKKNYLESNSWFQASLFGKKRFELGNAFEVYAGPQLGVSWMRSSKVNMETTNNKGLVVEQDSKNGLDTRNRLQPMFGLLAGVEYKLEKATIGLQGGFNWFGSTTVMGDQRLADEDFIFSTQYINDDVKMRVFTLSITISGPILHSIKSSK
ncbi:MAG: hypothetical protein ACI8ZN_001546 [Bacteroidia bacterium]|jgi:hypothetical protein